MVSRATSRCSNTTAPSRTSAIAVCSSWVSPAQAAELLARRRPIGGLGEPPLAQRKGLVGAEHQPARQAPAIARAFSRASSAAISPASRRGGALLRSPARRYRPGATSTGMPASRSIVRRTALFDASTSGCSASQSGIDHATGCRRRSASSLITAAAVSSIERRVTSMLGQLCRAHSLARERDLLGHRLAVDILVVVVMRLEPEQPVLADLHDPLRDWHRARPPAAASAPRRGATPSRPAPAERCRSSRRDWQDRSRSASSTCAIRRPARHRPPPDPRCAGRRHAAWCS